MQVRIDAGAIGRELRSALGRESKRVAGAIDAAVRDATDGLKEELRDRTFQVLGNRVAYAWQGRFYANRGEKGGPAGFVWTKAPRIIDYFRATRVVTPVGAAFAIPVNPVVKRGGRAMSPIEVEAKFNVELEARKLPSGNVGLFADLVRGRNGRGFRPDTRGRRSQGRAPEKVLLFVLVRSLRSRKLIDLEGPARRWGARIPQLVDAKLGN